MGTKHIASEIEFYESVLSMHRQMVDGRMNVDKETFFSKKIIDLVQEFYTADTMQPVMREQMYRIVNNTMVLLLTLFGQRDESKDFNDYDDLSDNDKERVKGLLFSLVQE